MIVLRKCSLRLVVNITMMHNEAFTDLDHSMTVIMKYCYLATSVGIINIHLKKDI